MKTKLSSIQALRAIAALGVVIHHTVQALQNSEVHASLFHSETWSPLGAAGVDIFFVISGFVIWFIAPARPLAPREQLGFLKNRALRIYPLYLIFTAISTLLFLARETRDQLTVKYVVFSALLVPTISPLNGGVHPVLDQGWTLFYEGGFYLVFSALLWLGAGRRLGVLLLVFAGLFGFAHTVSDLPALSIWQDPIIFEFALGCVLAIAYQKGFLPTGKVALLLAASGAVLFAASVIFFVGGNRLLVWGIPALLLVAGFVGWEKGSARETPWFDRLVPLGDASYSLYLCHSIVTLVLGALAKKNLLPVHNAGAIAVGLFSVGACILLGFVVHHGVERPIMDFARRMTKPKPVMMDTAEARTT